MTDRIVRLLELLLRFFRPVPSCHRVAVPLPVVERVDMPTLPLPRARMRVRVPLLRGEDTALVRPYLVAFEQREKECEQRERRRALLLAVHGIDMGPLIIHGVVVGR